MDAAFGDADSGHDVAFGYGSDEPIGRDVIFDCDCLGTADVLAAEALHAVAGVVVDAHRSIRVVELDDGAGGAESRAHAA